MSYFIQKLPRVLSGGDVISHPSALIPCVFPEVFPYCYPGRRLRFDKKPTRPPQKAGDGNDNPTVATAPDIGLGRPSCKTFDTKARF